MIRSIVLFAHVVGMLMLFAGLAVEWLCLASLRRVDPYRDTSSWIRVWASLSRVYGIASAVILLSGIYLAARVGVYDFAWVRVPFVTLVLMGILGGPVIRSRTRALFKVATADGLGMATAIQRSVADPLLRASLRLRIGLGLAVVYVMIAKPDLGVSLLVVGLGAAGASASLLYERPHTSSEHRRLTPPITRRLRTQDSSGPISGGAQ
jgi:hypothetical protein